MAFTTSPALLQILFSTPALLLEFITGLVYGWSAPAITFLRAKDSEIPITIEEASWIVSLCEVGRSIGCFAGGFLADKMGRKISLIMCAAIYTAGWVTITFSKSIMVLHIGRFTLGIGSAVADVVDGIYLSEVLSPAIRGSVMSSCLTLFFSGIIFLFVISTLTSYIVMNVTVMIISILILISTFFLIETPQHLIAISNFEKAQTNLEMIRVKEEALIELEEITKDIESQEKLKIKNISLIWKTPVNKRTMIIAVGLSMLTVFTGFYPITSYVSLLIKDKESQNYFLLYGIATFIASFITPFLIERAGRRMLLLVALSLSTILHSLTGILYISKLNVPSYVLFILFTSYAAIYASCIFPVVGILRTELLPQNIKGIGAAIAIASTCVSGFLTTKLFHEISDLVGIHWNFIVFAIFSALSLAMVYFLLPETRRKSLPQIQEIFALKYRK